MDYLQNTPGLLIDQPRNSLHPTSPSQPPNSRLGDALTNTMVDKQFIEQYNTWMLSLNTFRCLLAPPFPNPLPPLPRPVILLLSK